MLTKREMQILTKILGAEKAIRTKELSKEFKVSTRTIKSDIKNIRSWCKKNNIPFCSQPNKGIWVNCDENEKLRIYKLLMEEGNRDHYPDQHDRIEKILCYFLSQSGYITASQLSDYLFISRNTILNDLKYLEDIVKTWFIHLERKPRIGYRLIGEEIRLRLLFEHIIQKNLISFEIYKILSYVKSNQTVHNFLSISFFQPIQEMFEIVIRSMQKNFSDGYQQHISSQELLSIFIRLLIFLVRMNCGFTIGSYRLLKQKHSFQSISSKFLFNVMNSICKEMDFPLLEDEFLYVQRNFLLQKKDIDLLKITQQLIQYVSEKEKIPFYNDMSLFNHLLSHLSLRFEKHATYITEANPFNYELKKQHPSLFNSIKEACEKLFGINSTLIEESFISYIAIHFLVSYENFFQKKIKVNALYVCATGRGVARLVKSRVEREIGNINIAKYCSVMELDELNDNHGIDLIISVIPIKTNIPSVIVEPVPTEENINAIRDKVNELLANKKADPDEPTNDSEMECNSEETTKSLDNEKISAEIIMKGFEIFYEICDLLSDRITEEKKKGLHVHLFFMLHRYYFHQQYDQFIFQTNDQIDEQLLKQINQVLSRHHIFVNDSELMALLQYFH